MATTSRIKFNLAALMEESKKLLSNEIQALESELAQSPEEVLKEWRAQQTARLDEFHAAVHDGGVRDYALGTFSMEPAPRSDWRRNELRDRLFRTKSRLAAMSARAQSLVADEDGNVSLTKTQLREFFGL